MQSVIFNMKPLNAASQSSVELIGFFTVFTSKLVKGVVIESKLCMNLLYYPTGPRKDLTSFGLGLGLHRIASTLLTCGQSLPLPRWYPREPVSCCAHLHFATLNVNPSFWILSSVCYRCSRWSVQVLFWIMTLSR